MNETSCPDALVNCTTDSAQDCRSDVLVMGTDPAVYSVHIVHIACM